MVATNQTLPKSWDWGSYNAGSHFGCFCRYSEPGEEIRPQVWEEKWGLWCTSFLAMLWCTKISMRKDLHDSEFSNILEGAEVRDRKFEQKLERRKDRMNLLKRCQFTLRDSKGFEKLKLKLIECIDSLGKMCPGHLALVGASIWTK